MKPNTLPLWILVCLSLAALVGTAIGQNSSPPCRECAEWNLPQKPFRIFGKTYYVGPHGLSSILITSPSGHILIDGALPESARQIAENIRSLGFRIQDVKIILNSHVHFDHAGGIAELQRMSGARVIASKWSAAVMRKGGVGPGDPQFGAVRPIAPVQNVEELHDGETLRVGQISVTAHLTPGHTPGGTSWTWKSCEGDVCYDIVYADSLTPVSGKDFSFTTSHEYPQARDDFEKSFTFLRRTPCDILITTHPDTSGLWDRVGGRQRGVTPDPMVDAGACRLLADNARYQLQKRVDEELRNRMMRSH
ncbi:MAG: subclass B3 metallo-beta-lactamase [Candidatus Sulfotelmatobacter sp.]